jgi:predicted DCC family thiol-disulfide oxidoreductase YuxK
VQFGMKPVLIYDGKCGFCKIWIDYWRRLTGDRIEYATSQEVGGRYPQIPPRAFSESVQLVRPDGTVASGARAVFETLGKEKIYESSRLIAGISEFVYRFIARHRNFFYHLTKRTFGTHIEPARFVWTQWIFLRVLAIAYGAAFASLTVQITGLIGERGVAPLNDYLPVLARTFGAGHFFAAPMIFWWNSSDEMLRAVCWAGVALSVLLLAGFLERLSLVLLFVLYLSLSSAGQDFLVFQWDSLLLEAGFLAIFLGVAPVVVWLFRWLVFRLYFLSGSVKLLSGDPTWRNLTALDYHYHTQPLPTVLAWYVEKLPEWFHRTSTLLVFAIEIGLPFFIFMPRRMRIVAAKWMIAFQVLILLTGNYAFFNLLAIALCLFLFDDRALQWLVPRRVRERTWAAASRPGRVRRVVAAALAAVVLTLGAARMYQTFGNELHQPLRFLVSASAPFEIVSSYGLFAVMTTTRPEIIIEGSDGGETWMAYEFRYKPGDLRRAPRWAAPHQPRLDWQMWFAALGTFRENLWFVELAGRLLEGSPPVLGLLEKNPFPNRPPHYVRAMAYNYSFTDWETRRRTGAWWKRELLGVYLPPIGMRATAALRAQKNQ